METIKDLTRAEEQIMQVIWEIDRGFIKDFLEKLPEPKPAYNTVSTIVRILEVKGFVSHLAFGKTHQYFALIQKESYKDFIAHKMMGSYFNGSVKSMISFFVRQEKINLREADEIIKLIEKSKIQ